MVKVNYRMRLMSAALTLVMVISCFFTMSFGVSATGEKDEVNTNDNLSVTNSLKYHDYSEKYKDAEKPLKTVGINPTENYKAEKDAKVKVGEHAGKNALIWSSNNGEITWDFEIEEEGKYAVRLTYFSLNPSAMDVQFELKLDGKLPFFEAGQIIIPKCFTSETEIVKDERGNDIRPKQVSYEDWVTSSICDNSGVLDTPFEFYLSKGKHSLTIEGAIANIAIEKIEFFNSAELPSYEEYSKGISAVKSDYNKVYEAEAPLYQSSSVLYPMYDRTSVDTSPSDPVKLRYNTIGQSNFATHGQYIVWTVEVPEDGYYYLGARIRQNLNSGTNSYRRLYVNGEVPFKEAEQIKFVFNNKWQDYVFGGENPWLIKLNKGENQLKLEVVSGDMTEVIYDLQELVTKANALYREIIMITGTSPDTYRDYHIDKEIAGFNKTVKELSAEAKAIFDKAIKLGNTKSGNFSAITKLKMLLDRFLEVPSEIPDSIGTLNSYCSGISSLMLTVKNQPLELDTITVSARPDNLSKKGKGFFGNLSFQTRAFLGSFVEDYSSIGTAEAGAESQIEVWINLGREQANVLKSMADSLFTTKTKIGVNISLVQQSLIQATLSGMSPDVVLFVAEGDPINLAMRGGLMPVSKFDTFSEVTKRFQKYSMDAYYYNGEYYAIPITETFPMMFYRTDIFENLELTPPNSWDELYKIIRVLQHNNLSVGIPNADSSNVMSVDTGIYATLMYQNGETFYADDLKTTNLDSDVGIKMFDMWTEFYKDYGLPHQFDFFNRFRSGDMPIGLSAYTLYGKLKQAAPEIDGLWEMMPIPGTIGEDGKINRAVCASSTCAVIMKGAKNPEGAWDFIDWFSDTEAQTAYGQEMEALLGPTGRHAPANVEALANLSWTYKEQQLIYEQWNESFVLPQIPGSYIVSRNLVNAFRKVVFSSNNPRETIVSYNKTIETEIARKRKEFNLD